MAKKMSQNHTISVGEICKNLGDIEREVLSVFGGLKNKNILGLTINNVSPQEKDERIPNTKYIH